MLSIHLFGLCHVAKNLILAGVLKTVLFSQKEKADFWMSKDKEKLEIQVSQGDSIRQNKNAEEHGIESDC